MLRQIIVPSLIMVLAAAGPAIAQPRPTTAPPVALAVTAAEESTGTGSPDVDFLFRLAMLEGHLLVGHELVVAHQVPLALPHFGHPVKELYDDISPYLKEKKFPGFFRALRYVLVERSTGLHQRLEERFKQQIGESKVSLRKKIEDAEFGERTIVFANEFFDALPVEVLSDRGELRIGARDGQFEEQFVPPSPDVLKYVDQYSVHPEVGERVEAPLLAQDHMSRVAGKLKRGFLVVVDYGYTRQELLAGRHRDTISAFRQHTMSVSPYEAPGEQDITAHVNFAGLRAEGERAGVEHLALLTQAQFLMGIGEPNQFADAFEDCGSRQEQTKVALQLKHLVTPAGMGETFHVLLMSKGLDREAAGKMSGLRFS